jgi:hypothetical protein
MVINVTKRECLNPHKFGEGHELIQFTMSHGTMQALALLLSTSNGLGGGDLRTSNTEVPGRWAGDQIAIVGDYDNFSPYAGLFNECSGGTITDISYDVLAAMLDDSLVAESYAQNANWLALLPRWVEDVRDDLLNHPNLVAAWAAATEKK